MPPRPRRPTEGAPDIVLSSAPDARTLRRQPAGEPAADLSDPEQGAPEEPGVSVEPMEVGVQFLRDATEQYNFESSVRPEADHELEGVPVAQLISDATLESAQQGDLDVPVSAALEDEQPEVPDEPELDELDLESDAIRAASLFDRPVPSDELDEESEESEESEAEDDFAATVAEPLREPRVITDDPSEVDGDRREEIQRLLDERVKRRLRVDSLPGELGRRRE